MFSRYKGNTPDLGKLRTKEHNMNAATRKQREESASVHSRIRRHAIVACKLY
jgi:hypothetical protein